MSLKCKASDEPMCLDDFSLAYVVLYVIGAIKLINFTFNTAYV